MEAQPPTVVWKIGAISVYYVRTQIGYFSTNFSPIFDNFIYLLTKFSELRIGNRLQKKTDSVPILVEMLPFLGIGGLSEFRSKFC